MKNLRIVIALAVILAVVVIAQGGASAWSNRLHPATNSAQSAPAQSGVRPQGTTSGNPKVDVGTPGDCALIQTYCVESNETELVAEGLTELPAGLTPPEGRAADVTRIIQITGKEGVLSLTEDLWFILEPALATNEVVAYWDTATSKWVELTLDPKLNKYIVPKGATLPINLVVFIKK